MPNNLIAELPNLPQRRYSHLVPGQDVSPNAPLRGLTVLAVEDSRFASEALRLMCQRIGARLRRAETLQMAYSHLRLYRPDVVIVDLGLPDGRGEALIRDLASARCPVVIGTSGDLGGRASALAAGADGFLDKPLESLAAFQAALLRHLPQAVQTAPPTETTVMPDTLALRDDLAHAAALIEAGTDEAGQKYLSAFLGGVARHARDPALAAAAAAAGSAPLAGQLDHLGAMLRRRLAASDGAFCATTPTS
ncbi:MAG: response regulator [Paracoccaceae bacterium]